MERANGYKRGLAWLLVALLILPATTQAIHILEEEHAPAQDTHAHHDCGSCAICHFTLSTFTGTESVACEHAFAPAPSEPVVFF